MVFCGFCKWLSESKNCIYQVIHNFCHCSAIMTWTEAEVNRWQWNYDLPSKCSEINKNYTNSYLFNKLIKLLKLASERSSFGSLFKHKQKKKKEFLVDSSLIDGSRFEHLLFFVTCEWPGSKCIQIMYNNKFLIFLCPKYYN